MNTKICIQRALTEAGYSSNYFARKLGRDIERIVRPWKWGQPHYKSTSFLELVERVQRAVSLPFSGLFAFLGGAVSILFLSAATLLGGPNLEVHHYPGSTPTPLHKRTFTFMSLNSCLQEGGFAPLTGKVAPPSEPTAHESSRTAALAKWVGTATLGGSPDIFVGQEFHDHNAQDVFIETLRPFGYRYFAFQRMKHPLWMNSGLFVASKRAIKDLSFIPYPKEDRVGLAKGTLQGVLAFSVIGPDQTCLFRVFNTHLNYGSNQECCAARARQLRNHVIPLFQQPQPALLAGDFNFETSDAGAKKAAGLEPFTNFCEGIPTTDEEGDPYLRKANQPAPTSPGSSIDGLVPNSSAVQISNLQVRKVVLNDSLLTDHFAVSATIDVSSPTSSESSINDSIPNSSIAQILDSQISDHFSSPSDHQPIISTIEMLPDGFSHSTSSSAASGPQAPAL